MNVHDFSVKDNEQKEVPLARYKGKVLLVVNTATKCGLTPQYEQLEALYKKYHDRGFEILDFPSNQFLKQAPGSDEDINVFCTLNYGTTFPRFAKIDVNGEQADPLFVYLKQAAPTETEDAKGGAFRVMTKVLHPFSKAGDIQWNFSKFLVGRDGEVAGRFAPTCKPGDLESAVEALL